VIGVLFTLGVSLVLGAALGLAVRRRSPKGAATATPAWSTPAYRGGFRVLSRRSPSGLIVRAERPATARREVRSEARSALVATPPVAATIRLTRRGVAPDACCFVCGRQLRECTGHGA
jgi:hypothetical protein